MMGTPKNYPLRKYLIHGSLLGGALILALLSYVVPKKKGFYLFGSGDGNYVRGNPKYLFLRLNDPRHIFYTRNRREAELLRKRGLRTNACRVGELLNILRAEMIVIESVGLDVSPFFYLIGRFSIIQTWHGTANKRFGSDSRYDRHHDKTHRFLNPIFQRSIAFICATNPESQRFYRSAFRNPRVYITGFPRNDVLVTPALALNDLANKLSLHNRKILLYAPTWRRDGAPLAPFDRHFLKKLNNYLETHNAVMLMKKHEKTSSIDVDPFPTIIDVSAEVDDIQELLLVTDLLITDYSSVVFDYAICDRPIIFYPFDYEEYTATCKDMYYDYFDVMPGPFARTSDELFALIQAPPEHPDRMKAFARRFHTHQDGLSSERVHALMQKVSRGEPLDESL